MNEPWYAYVLVGFALVGTFLNARKNMWCWPLWLISNSGLALYFSINHLWSQTVLQTVFFILSAYGWYSWREKSAVD